MSVEQEASLRALPRGEAHERPGWAAPSVLIAFVAALSFVFWPTVQSLFIEWLDTHKRVYTHGLLVAATCLWLLLRANPRFGPVVERGAAQAIACAAVLLLSALWLLTYRAGIQVGHQALLPLIMLGALRIAFGTEVARRSAMPVLLLYSAIPVWDVGVDVLQWLTISVVGLALKVCGIPAWISGDLVHIRSGVFEVEQGCAGLHYFVVALTLAAMYGELERAAVRTRLSLLALAAAIALVVNWLRVFTIVVAGYLTDMQHFLVQVDHYYFGWVLFGLAMVVFFIYARGLVGDDSVEAGSGVVAGPGSASAGTLAARSMAGIAAALVVAAAGPLYSLAVPLAAAEQPNVALPKSMAGSVAVPGCSSGWNPSYLGADTLSLLEYRFEGHTLCAFSASYLLQQQDKEVVGFLNALNPASVRVIAAATVEVDGIQLQEQRLEGSGANDVLVWHTYVIGKRVTSRPLAAQLLYAVDSLTSAPASSVVAFRVECASSCSSAEAVLHRFVAMAKLRPTTNQEDR